jgi:hypothetical protein
MQLVTIPTKFAERLPAALAAPAKNPENARLAGAILAADFT